MLGKIYASFISELKQQTGFMPVQSKCKIVWMLVCPCWSPGGVVAQL